MNTEQKTYSCIIVDDNELDRMAIASYAGKYSFLRIEGVFASAVQVLSWIAQSKRPDILFLDIDMPGMNGLHLRKQLEDVPACIFVTGHPEFALESFETAALDYLVKPMNADRFEKTMQRLEHFLEIHYKAELLDYTLGEDTLFIKDGHHHIKLQLYDIIYLEALKDYTGIITRNKKYCVLTPLGNLLKEKSFQAFIRIHRSYAIQKHAIKEISSKEIMVENTLLPVGRSYREAVEKLLIR